jgi:ABC-type lipoprotein release transport system permease subunit
MYKVILPFRYLFKKRISYLALVAVALCVFIVVVVMTVMTGLVRDFKQKNHNFVGDCVVGTESLVGFSYYEDFMKVLKQADFIEGVSAVIKNYALINPRTRSTASVLRLWESTLPDTVRLRVSAKRCTTTKTMFRGRLSRAMTRNLRAALSG